MRVTDEKLSVWAEDVRAVKRYLRDRGELHALTETMLDNLHADMLNARVGAVEPSWADRKIIAEWAIPGRGDEQAHLVTRETVDEFLTRALAHQPSRAFEQALRGAAQRIRTAGR